MQGVGAEERRLERWLAWLREGSEADKIAARSGLAGVFEQRGMLREAIELLERNVEVGVRSPETLRWLSRLYQAQGDEIRRLEVAVDASRAQRVPPVSEQAHVGEAPAHPIRGQSIRGLTPYVVMVLGLGTVVGAGLWMLTLFLTP